MGEEVKVSSDTVNDDGTITEPTETGEATETTESTPETTPDLEIKPKGSSERPEWLPEKFQSPEDMAKSYQELEAKLAAKPEADTTDGETPETGDAPPAGLSTEVFEGLVNEFQKEGQLADESYEKLSKIGIPKDVVDQYIAGRVAQQEAIATSLITDAGGQEAYGEMVAWAGEHYSEAETLAFNQAINAGVESARMAVLALKGRYQEANGMPAQLVEGGASAPLPNVFKSHEQFVKAIQDSRYESDPAYRDEVSKRLARSNI